ncbi:MAG: enoyl-CoA hydratase/isomerase family protein [Anaerolineales bacterium]|nr:enoyl-CoA hydratase/isomerase family protein [Anaerolineales bacterium]
MTSLQTDLKDSTLYLTLNRPERANAFNFEMTQALQNALTEAERDSQVRCAVITGAGKTFSAGQDIREMKEYSGEISYAEHLEKTYNPLILQLREMGKPVIAAVNGACAGAAFGIALACDLRVAHVRSYFVVGFSGIALAPDSGVSLLLPALVGLGRAQEYFYTNQPIFAYEARKLGIVNRVGELGFQRTVRQTAQELVQGPSEAFALGKRAFNEAALPNLAQVLRGEGILQEQAGRSDEHRLAVKAFFEKRKK